MPSPSLHGRELKFQGTISLLQPNTSNIWAVVASVLVVVQKLALSSALSGAPTLPCQNLPAGTMFSPVSFVPVLPVQYCADLTRAAL